MMRTFTKFMALSVTALVIGCGAPCENQIAENIVSPSGKLRVVVFHRECGATTDFNTQISIIKATASLQENEGGNVVVVNGNVRPNIQWSSDVTLSVSGIGADGGFKRESSVMGVEISYK